MFYFNDDLFFNRDISRLEEKAECIYADIFEIIKIDSVSFIGTCKNTCELIPFNRYSIIFNIHLHFDNGEIISFEKCLICDCSSCFKI